MPENSPEDIEKKILKLHMHLNSYPNYKIFIYLPYQTKIPNCFKVPISKWLCENNKLLVN